MLKRINKNNGSGRSPMIRAGKVEYEYEFAVRTQAIAAGGREFTGKLRDNGLADSYNSATYATWLLWIIHHPNFQSQSGGR